jgi:hypothetical protein
MNYDMETISKEAAVAYLWNKHWIVLVALRKTTKNFIQNSRKSVVS